MTSELALKKKNCCIQTWNLARVEGYRRIRFDQPKWEDLDQFDTRSSHGNPQSAVLLCFYDVSIIIMAHGPSRWVGSSGNRWSTSAAKNLIFLKIWKPGVIWFFFFLKKNLFSLLSIDVYKIFFFFNKTCLLFWYNCICFFFYLMS